MLKLINIKIDDESIEADYYPESEKETAYIKLYFDGRTVSKPLQGYEINYPIKAKWGLREIIKDLSNGKEIPKERLVMWY